MKLRFYQVPVIFIDNSTYLGSLVELEQQDLNVDLGNLERIKVLLNSNFTKYNYVKVEAPDDVNKFYYYYLHETSYYNNEKTHFIYRLDVIRTLRERNQMNYPVAISKYSGQLEMDNQAKNYFWRNQGFKLSSNIKEANYPTQTLPIKGDKNIQAWANVKWLYLWVQPRETRETVIPDNSSSDKIKFQYAVTRTKSESIIEVTNSEMYVGKFAIRPLRYINGQPEEDLVNYQPPQRGYFYGQFPVGQLYYNTNNQRYYRYTESRKRIVYLVSAGREFAKRVLVQEFVETVDIKPSKNTFYYMNNTPAVTMTDTHNSLRCIVLPTQDIKLRGYYYDENNTYHEVNKIWSADNILPYILDPEGSSNWVSYIVDLKISDMPPFNVEDAKLNFISDLANMNRPSIQLPLLNGDDNFSRLNTLQDSTAVYYDGAQIDPDVFIPFLRVKPEAPIMLKSDFTFPDISRANLLEKKYMLSITEQRVELDVPLLLLDDAKTLYYYEDINPGRNNIVLGFGPSNNDNQQLVYYLLHSPSSIVLTRDISLPIFTPKYQDYLANNKNFMQQAELTRNSQLNQQLVQSGAAIVGSSMVALSVPGYSPAASISGAMGSIGAGLIQYDAHKKQTQWTIENMKAAPGNYKAAVANTSLMLSLGSYEVWIEVFKTSEFDIRMYDNIIKNMGYDYFDFEYNFQAIINNTFTEQNSKLYLQANIIGTLIGITDMPLFTHLKTYLREGVNIFK